MRAMPRCRAAALCAALLAAGGSGAPAAWASDDLRAGYAAALRAAVQRTWLRPDTLAEGQHCRVLVRQLPGGEVVAVEPLPDCDFDAQARQSLVRAVHRASPLPYAGFERVFERSLDLGFTAPDR
ncbi:TonB C-terminal domain-containing protein [Luteimonas sp. BDR2-5]|uniref:cell envelope integrity protein TolA n=1 Tax=Proluteimonas luteida TaxID=2878685 RepID=UPI001E54B788|nr:cell envelope integrity protein TolA [Luteimonas sp. BDR2-5]MCD9027441.1 TonB C-terminal domain-containing protein [Luteimonas sp. BDR2-5]